MNAFDQKNQEEVAKFVLENLHKHTLMALGTVDEAGKPWVVCVHLALDKKLNIIWKSRKDTEHSKNIEKNPEVSICIFSRTDDVGDFGFYTKAVAREVIDRDELAACLQAMHEKMGKEVPVLEDHLGDSDFRIYVAEIKEAWMNHSRTKQKIDLDTLRQKAKETHV
jgi:uncharacterized pyridoxamine 5'-phosphate oxidase family protein